MSAEITVREYQGEVDEWIRNVGVRYFSELTNLAQLVEEVGEVARIMSQNVRGTEFQGGMRAAANSGMSLQTCFLSLRA